MAAATAGCLTHSHEMPTTYCDVTQSVAFNTVA